MININDLVNLDFDGVGFYKYSWVLEFSGMKSNEYFKLSLSTNYNISFTDNLETNSCGQISEKLWNILENRLIAIDSNDINRVILKFENSEDIYIWSEENATDNLIIVKDCNSDSWFTIC